MSGVNLALLGAPVGPGAGGVAPSATFTVTTTSAQTLTLQALGVLAGKTVTVNWGDLSSNDFTGDGTRTHNYAGAGTWTVTITDARNVYALDLRDSQITTLNSADISSMALTYPRLYLSSATGTFNSADISSMALTTLYLYLPSATVTFNSADISSMALTTLYLYLSSATGTFNSADISSMALTYLYLNLPSATGTTIARADWAAGVLRKVPSPTVQMGLTQTKVDYVLLGAHDDFGNRTATGGTFNVAGNNAAPSGILQAQCPPTTGKEAAFELVNDSCSVSANHYAAVTIS